MWVGLLIQAGITAFLAGASGWDSERIGLATTTKPLAIGQSQFTFFVGQRNSQERLTENGTSESIGTGFTKVHQTESGQLEQIYAIERQQYFFVPAWSHGITSRWTFGIQLPITANKTIVQDENRYTDAEGKVSNFSSSAVRENFGIQQSVESEQDVQIGNVQINSKYVVWDNEFWRWALLQRLSFPSAESSNTDVLINPVPQPNGYSVGTGLLAEWIAGAKLNLNFMSEYRANFKDKIQLRGMRRSSLHGFERDPGDVWQAQLGAEYLFFRAMNFFFDYVHWHKYDDKIENWEGEQNTSGLMNIARVGVGYTNQLWLARFNYSSIIAGKSTDASDWLSLQFSVMY